MADPIQLPAGYKLDVPSGPVTVPGGYTLDEPNHAAAEQPSFGGFLKNAASSAGKFAGDIGHAVSHPGETLGAVVGLGEGMAEKSGFPAVNGVPHTHYVDALVNEYKDRYGSWDGLKHALYTDPVGVAADIATLASGSGAIAGAVEGAAKVAKLPALVRIAGTAGDVADAVSAVTDPLRIAGKVADVTGLTGLASKGADTAKVALAKSALRGGFNVNADAEDIAAAAATVAKKGIPLSEKGQTTISQALADLQKAKLDEVGSAARGGVTIDPQRVQMRLDDVRKQYGMQVNPDADLKQIDKAADTFSRNNPGPIPVDQAELLKEGTYKANATKYGKGAPPQMQATAAAEEALARGLKEEIENALPEVGGINSKQAELLNLQPILQRAVNKYVNGGGFTGNLKRQVFSKTGLEIGGATGLVSHSPEYGVAAAVMNAVLSDPMVKSRLAQAINWAQQANPGKYGAPSVATALSRVDEYAKTLQEKK